MKRRWWIVGLALLLVGGIWSAALLLGRPPYPFLSEAEVYQFKIWPKGKYPDLVTITYAFRRPYSEVVAGARREVPGKWTVSKKRGASYNNLISVHEWREALRPKIGAYSDMPSGTTCTAYVVRPATFADRIRLWLWQLRGKPQAP